MKILQRHLARGLALAAALALLSACATVEEAPTTSTVTPDLRSWTLVREWTIERSPRAFALAPDGSWAVFSFIDPQRDSTIMRLDADSDTMTPLEPDLPTRVPGGVNRLSGEAKSFSIAPDGQSFAGSWPGATLVMSPADAGITRIIRHNRGNEWLYFNDIGHTPDGDRLVGVSGKLRWADLSSGEFIVERELPPGGARKMDVMGADTAFVALNQSTEVITAGVAEPRCRFDLGQAIDLKASPNGARLAASRRDGLAVWRAADCSPVRDWDIDGLAVNLAWLPDGRHFVASTGTGTVNFWDSETGDLAHSLQAHDEGVTLLGMTPDGRTLMTVKGWGDEKQVRLWRAGSAP